jgi:hypothetical protein
MRRQQQGSHSPLSIVCRAYYAFRPGGRRPRPTFTGKPVRLRRGWKSVLFQATCPALAIERSVVAECHPRHALCQDNPQPALVARPQRARVACDGRR